jgi:hypothetical protein
MIIHGLGRAHRRAAHRLAGGLVHARRGGFLDHLLVAALQRAIALEQMDDIAVRVAEHLHFDMARAFDPFFQQHDIIAEARRRLALARKERVGETGRVIDLAHPLAAAACDRLDQHRIADPLGLGRQPLRRLILTQIARRGGDARGVHQLLRRVLETHRADRVRLRPDPDQPGGDHGLGEFGVLGQEAVTRMDRLRAGRLRRRDDLLAHQVALARRRRPDMHRLVRLTHMQRLGVGVRIDRDGADAHGARGADDPASDFAAIGDEEGFQHGA